MSKSKDGGTTININVNTANENSALEKVQQLAAWELVGKEIAMTREEIAQELEKGTLVDANDGDGGTIHERLICRPRGGTKYYEDTKNGTKVVLVKEIKSPYYIGTGKPE